MRLEGEGIMNWLRYCTSCGRAYVCESGQALPEKCSFCSDNDGKDSKRLLKRDLKRSEIVAISTSEFKNRKVVKTLGIVSREHILGLNLDGADLNKFNREVALSWAKKINDGRDLAISSIQDKAFELGGNAIIGVDVNYNILGSHNGILMMLIVAKGTAVVVE